MIRVATPGAAFTTAVDGDLRSDPRARHRVSEALGIPSAWAVTRQIHGHAVVDVEAPGSQGDADALVTSRTMLPLAVLTADCVGVVAHAEGAVGVAHAGWRGAAGGVIEAMRRSLEASGGPLRRAVLGPHIGPGCFEVGPEVAERFDGHVSRTTWGTVSVDLASSIEERLGVEVERLGECTMCGSDGFSHRRDGDDRRMAAIGWIP